MKIASWIVGGVMAFGVVAGLPAWGAVLTGSVNLTPPATEDLTADGPVDWAIWDYQAGSAGGSGAPSNRKTGVTPVIGNVSGVLGTPRGITGTVTSPKYTYTDGTSPTSQTAASIGAITDTSINSVGSGVQFAVTGDPTKLETVNVLVTGFNSVGMFSATLNGAPVYTDSSKSYSSTRVPVTYTLTFQPDSAADVLQISYTIKSLNTGGNSNVDLQAVTVIAPEPTSLAVVGVIGTIWGLRRRERRRI
jgi:hypothetical protein